MALAFVRMFEAALELYFANYIDNNTPTQEALQSTTEELFRLDTQSGTATYPKRYGHSTVNHGEIMDLVSETSFTNLWFKIIAIWPDDFDIGSADEPSYDGY